MDGCMNIWMNGYCKCFCVCVCAIFSRALGSVWHSLDEFYKHLLLYFDYSFRRSINVQTKITKKKLMLSGLQRINYIRHFSIFFTSFAFVCISSPLFVELTELGHNKSNSGNANKKLQLF